MTVSSIIAKITYAGDGATTSFTFPYAVTGPADIQVLITDSIGHVTTQPTTAYTIVINPPINPNPTPIGGTVNYPLVGPPLAVGSSITIARVLVETQVVSIAAQSIVYPPIVEQTFDRLTMMDQQVSEQIGRAISVPIGDANPPPLPPATLRANTQAVFDSSGNMTAGGAVVGTIISAVMIPVVTAPTLPLAQTAMQVAPLASPALTGVPTSATTPPFGDNSTTIANTAYVQAQLVGLGMVMTTGDLKPTHKTVADVGWILWVDGTIGDATSGSSVRANADTSALFALYYNGYSDANCPLLTSAGAATTRAAQGTSTVAFAAHCRMNLPKGSGRAVGLAGVGSGLTTRALGSTFGAETVTMTIAQMPAHNHTAATSGPHLHNVPDPGHLHGIADPQHLHAFAGSTPTTTGGVIAPPTSGGTINMYTTDGPYISATLNAPTGITQTDFRGTGIGNTAVTDIGINVFNAGSGAAMNVMNPMAYINIMIKL